MRWKYAIRQYIDLYCTARGLSSKTLKAYEEALRIYEAFARGRMGKKGPEEMSTRDIIEYTEYLRKERKNKHGAVNRASTILRGFYKSLVAIGYISSFRDNPMEGFPKFKAEKVRYKEVLTDGEVMRLVNAPDKRTEIGVRDAAIIVMFYGTGIRVAELAGLLERDVLLDERTIKVTGKGGNHRVVPMNDAVVEAVTCYRSSRGEVGKDKAFFMSRQGKALTTNAIRARIKKYARMVKIEKNVTPHVLRHTFATHLVKQDVNIVVLRDLLGHRQIASTQIYIHMTAQDLREAAEKHPIKDLIKKVFELVPTFRLPFQNPPGKQYAFAR